MKMFNNLNIYYIFDALSTIKLSFILLRHESQRWMSQNVGNKTKIKGWSHLGSRLSKAANGEINSLIVPEKDGLLPLG